MDENNDFKAAIKAATPAQFPDFTAVNEALKAAANNPISHTWIQQGPHLICTSCPHSHSQWVGVDKRLTGYDEKGAPILEEIKR